MNTINKFIYLIYSKLHKLFMRCGLNDNQLSLSQEVLFDPNKYTYYLEQANSYFNYLENNPYKSEITNLDPSKNNSIANSTIITLDNSIIPANNTDIEMNNINTNIINKNNDTDSLSYEVSEIEMEIEEEIGRTIANSVISNKDIPHYSHDVLRYEWPPWAKLTGYRQLPTLTVDYVIRLADHCIVVNRKHKIYETNPFVRSIVTFYYGDNVTKYHDAITNNNNANNNNSANAAINGIEGFVIYEEFTFNWDGEINFIEAWSKNTILNELDSEGFPIPITNINTWPSQIKHISGSGIRLSDIIPGLGCRATHGKAILTNINSNYNVINLKNNADYQNLVSMSSNFEIAVIKEQILESKNSTLNTINM